MEKNFIYVTIPVEENKVTNNLLNPTCFYQYKIEKKSRKIMDLKLMENAPIDARKLVKWLAEKLTDVLIFAGMNEHINKICRQEGIKLVWGVDPKPPRKVITEFLSGS